MAKSILLVKTSSLGDVIHALPAISDVRTTGAADVVDWVVEEPFAVVPGLHSGVAGVLPVAIRRWRRTIWQEKTRSEITQYLRRVRARRYDAVIDAQGLLKSALVALAAHGPRFGLDWRSAREPLALFYQRAFSIPRSLHAVERNRLLLARALGYTVPAHCDYGISSAPRRFEWLAASQYAVLLHATSGDYKLWPEHYWMDLGNRLNTGGMCCVLPWGDTREYERASRIADGVRSVVVAPALGIEDFPGLFASAQAVVGVDTGLMHLAAALNVPTIGIYCGTDPAATGVYGCARALNLGGIGSVPAVAEVMAALARIWS